MKFKFAVLCLLGVFLTTELKVHEDAFNNLRAVVNGKRNELIQQKKHYFSVYQKQKER